MLVLALSGCASANVAQSVLPRTAAKASASASPTRIVHAPKRPHPWQPVGDIDGDGKPDRARLVKLQRATPNSQFGWTYRLDLRLSRVGSVSTDFEGDPPLPGAGIDFNTHVLGGADIDGDGRPEVFVQVAHGASTALVSPFRVIGRRVVQLSEGGYPAVFGVNGSVTHLDGFSCRPPVLTVWGATATPNGRAYNEGISRYRLSGSTLVLLSTDQKRVPGSQPGAHGFVDCGGLRAG